MESKSKIRFFTKYESLSKPDVKSLLKKLEFDLTAKATEKINKLRRLLHLQELHRKIELVDSIDDLMDVKPVILSFEFDEIVHNEQLIAFTHTSSWVGNVRFDTETLGMRILMNGKAYNFCGVPRRVYDAFEGSPSKGEFYWRQLRQLYDC